ncbi:hypothetical protein C8J56DRAFT_757775, partial [Mycena floridula]
GPPIPRRDSEIHVEKHARLMLILFKPWAHPSDLRNDNESWSETYQTFLTNADARVKRLIDNMQVLHECRDARDD